MKLEIIAANGHAAWWTWAIHDEKGVLVESSTTQFRSNTAAETEGKARMAELANWVRQGAGPRSWEIGRTQ